MDLARQMVHVNLHLVEACRRQGETQQPVHPNYPAAAGWEGQGVQQAAGAHMLSLRALARLAGADVARHVTSLPRSIGEASNQCRRLVAPEVPIWEFAPKRYPDLSYLILFSPKLSLIARTF